MFSFFSRRPVRRRPGRSPLAAPAAVLVLLGLAACEDPSNVGLGVLGEQSANPVRIRTEADSTGREPFRDVTGDESTSLAVSPVLAGAVSDPLFGRIESIGFVDFGTPTAITQPFRDAQVRKVELRLARTYIYGDTLQSLTFALHDMPAAWNAASRRADSVLTPGAEVMRATFDVRERQLVFQLPDAWVQANDTTLRSTRFSTVFHGFALRPEGSNNAVLGFNGGGVTMRVYSQADTLDYPILRLFSQPSRNGEPQPPPELLPVQDGVGPAVRVVFPAPADSLRNSSINRATIRVEADTVALAADLPPHFVRPILRRLTLYGHTEAGARTALAEASLDSTSAFAFSTLGLTGALQQDLLGRQVFRHFEIAPEDDQRTLNAVLLFGAGSTRGPQMSLTLITER